MIDRLKQRLGLEEGELPLWERYNHEILVAEVQSDERSAQYAFGLNAFTDDEKVFPGFPGCVVKGIDWDPDELRTWNAGAGMDLAGERRRGTWIVVAMRRPSDGRKIVTEDSVFRGGFSTQQKLDAIDKAFSTFNIHTFVIEDNAFQRMLVEIPEMLPTRYPWWDRLMGHETGKNKHDRAIGLPALETQFAARGWEFWYRKEHRPGCNCNLCVLVEQFNGYVAAEALEFDAVMATWKAEFAMRRIGGRPIAGIKAPLSEKALEAKMAEVEARREARIKAILDAKKQAESDESGTPDP